jgi:hypothetical protein
VSTRSDDLTADLLHDLVEEQAAPQPAPQPKAALSKAEPAPAATVETSLFLAPSTWRRPGITRTGRSLSINAGPVQIRLGR